MLCFIEYCITSDWRSQVRIFKTIILRHNYSILWIKAFSTPLNILVPILHVTVRSNVHNIVSQSFIPKIFCVFIFLCACLCARIVIFLGPLVRKMSKKINEKLLIFHFYSLLSSFSVIYFFPLFTAFRRVTFESEFSYLFFVWRRFKQHVCR